MILAVLVAGSLPLRADLNKIAEGIGGFSATALDANDQLGTGLTPIGDLDGNGVTDIAIGAGGDDDGGTNKGAFYVCFMDSSRQVIHQTKVNAAAITPFANAAGVGRIDAGDYFGSTLACLGDLDGDGTIEVAVGAVSDDDGLMNSGSVWIVSLDSSGTVTNAVKINRIRELPNVLAPADLPGFRAGFGGALSTGDLDGDGRKELFVGAQRSPYVGANAESGAVYVLFMNTDGTLAAANRIAVAALGANAFDLGGSGVAFLGDVDGDTVPDLAIGARGHDAGGPNRGSFIVTFMNTDGTFRASQRVSDNVGGFTPDLHDQDNFGLKITGTGDRNGDAIPDVAVGAFRRGPGSFFLINLNGDGTVLGQTEFENGVGMLDTFPLDDNDQFGNNLTVYTDGSGSTTLEFAIGARNDDDGGNNQGAIYLLQTATPDLICPSNVTAECSGDTSPANTGTAAATAGSVNCEPLLGVTFSDVVVPDPSYPGGETIFRTWTATNNCGNVSECTQTIRVVDTTPPVITGVPGSVNVDCVELVPAPVTATVTDNCDGVSSTTASVSDNGGSGCVGDPLIITYRYTATDARGNAAAPVIQTITVEDGTAPTFTSVPADITLEIGDSTMPANTGGVATATDNGCTGTTVSFIDTLVVDTLCEKVIKRHFTTMDGCGNTSPAKIQTITLLDTAAPVLTVPADVSIDCTESTAPSNTGHATAIDSNTGVTVTYSDTYVRSGTTIRITRKWEAIDECGNVAPAGYQEITRINCR